MKVTAAGLKKLETNYKGYLEGEIIDRFFDEFGIRFGPGSGRPAVSTTVLWAAATTRDWMTV